MEMQFKPLFGKSLNRPFIIAGPCSAETEEQVLKTAQALADQQVDLFRSGIWKPRTRPNSFEGVGEPGLKWLQRVKKETGLRVTTEVANARHVALALEHEIDVLWIGARTTVNPFSVQEIADALKGIDIPVMVKNPINPDFDLWVGAIERIYKVGIRRIAAIHRGFSYYGEMRYRNAPRWQLPIELKRQYPDLPIFCDNSHICGRRDLLAKVAQKAYDLHFDGLMTEVHPCPEEAWSDAKQQLTPSDYLAMQEQLLYRKLTTDDPEYLESLHHFRQEIDEIDVELLDLLVKRMAVVEKIGQYKKKKNIAILQPERWNQILENCVGKGLKDGLSEAFLLRYLQAVHQESINHQGKIMSESNGFGENDVLKNFSV